MTRAEAITWGAIGALIAFSITLIPLMVLFG